MEKALKITKEIFAKFEVAAAIILFGTCLLVVVNVITRTDLFKAPVFGAYEIVSFLTLIAVSFALANCSITDGHVRLSFLVDKLSPKKRTAIEIILTLIATVNFILITWNLGKYMLERLALGEVASVLRISIHYIVAFVVFGFFLLVIAQIIKIIDMVKYWKAN
ncbi:MAG: TRAP transporter small permease [Peptococcaceae bacterium]|nr:TRAP transporter small permease [Peptococcaceae bacterium]